MMVGKRSCSLWLVFSSLLVCVLCANLRRTGFSVVDDVARTMPNLIVESGTREIPRWYSIAHYFVFEAPGWSR